jgi:hypothetical protein
MKIMIFGCRAFVSCVALGAASVACAGTSLFNPDNLDSAQLTHVAEVCQTVLGLSPTERLQGGNRIGDDRLDYWTSHYRGCILSLSDSLGTIGAARAPNPALTLSGGQFMFASPREVSRREELACSSLAVDLSGEEISRCMHGLEQTFFSVDHPIE